MRNFRAIIEGAGAVFVAVDAASVRFRDPEDVELIELSLYRFACRDVQDVRLALKAHREKIHETGEWEKAG